MNTGVKDRVAQTVSAMHNLLDRPTGGRLGGTLWIAPVLLLTTTGRKSGKAHTTPLGYIQDGDRVILTAVT